MTHDELVQRAARWLANSRRCAVVLVEPAGVCQGEEPNGAGRGALGESPDAIGFLYSGGRSVVVEVKAGRDDFLGDKHKAHRKLDRNGGRPGLGWERWYLTLKGVILPSDELHGWGHLEVRGSRVYRVAKPVVRPGLPPRELGVLVSVLNRGERPWARAEDRL